MSNSEALPQSSISNPGQAKASSSVQATASNQSLPASPNLVSVVGEQFCAPTRVRFIAKFEGDRYIVRDPDTRDTMFMVKPGLRSSRKFNVLDGQNNFIISLKRKTLSARKKWFGYAEENESRQIFMVKKTRGKMPYFHKVFRSPEEKIIAFEIHGSKGDYTISDIQQSHREIANGNSMRASKGEVMITIHPRVDRVFVISLMFIANHVKMSTRKILNSGAKIAAGALTAVSDIAGIGGLLYTGVDEQDDDEDDPEDPEGDDVDEDEEENWEEPEGHVNY